MSVYFSPRLITYWKPEGLLLSPTIESVIIDGSPSELDDDGRVSLTALLGLISVVAIIKKTNNRKIRSVIDDDENDESILELLFIAIAKLLLYWLVKDIHKGDCGSLHSKYKTLDARYKVVVSKV